MTGNHIESTPNKFESILDSYIPKSLIDDQNLLESLIDDLTPLTFTLRDSTFTVANGSELLALSRDVLALYRKLSETVCYSAAEVDRIKTDEYPAPALAASGAVRDC